MSRVLALVAALLTVTGVQTAQGGPKQLHGGWTAHAPVPDQTNQLGAVRPSTNYACGQVLPTAAQSADSRFVRVTGRATLVVTISDFVGDWDALIEDSKGTDVGASYHSNTNSPLTPQSDVATARITRAGTYRMTACNWAGGDTATVSWVLTYR